VKLPIKERASSATVIIPSVIIVIVLAALQYWWSLRLREATAVRLADSLQMSMTNWQSDFFRDLMDVSMAIRTDSTDSTPRGLEQYARRLAEWRVVARYPDLIGGVWVLKPSLARSPHGLRLRPPADSFEEVEMNPQLRAIDPALQATTTKFIAEYAEKWKTAGAAAFNPVLSANLLGVQGVSSGWQFEPAIPALLHPIVSIQGGRPALEPGDIDWIAIELNPQVIRRILADLSETYFRGTAGLDYQIAVLSGAKVIYSSDAGFGSVPIGDADGTLDIFGRSDRKDQLPLHIFHTPADNTTARLRLAFFPLLNGGPQTSDWQLIVRHRRGGALGSFVADMRRRDTAISAGLLLLVGVNLAMLIATSHRARRLAQLQMNFVTAVSHELRTPLTVIMSGAENICNGVVESKQQMQQYGSVIGSQARQLFGLVERILLFASTRQGLHRFEMRPLRTEDVIDNALASTAGLIEAGEVTVECHVAPDLPPVMGDAAALSQCLQNLITNALKYGKNEKWMRVCAGRTADGGVEISVSDRGIGIAAEDLPHIFEPFYRSPAVRAAQIRGSGIGLPLSRSIAEAMKGQLTVSSVAGHGSIFTVHLPAAPAMTKPELA